MSAHPSRPSRAFLRRLAAATALVSAAGTLGFAASAASAATERIETPIASTSPQTDVTASVVRLHVPMLPGAAPHPGVCDWIAYQRYRLTTGPTDATQADSVAVLMPGILEGATAFDAVARNAIRESARRGRTIEVWAIDRRANCLEDHTGIDFATDSGVPSDAIDYYYRGKVLNGRTFRGFKSSDRVLGDIGLAQTIHDYNAVLTRELPSQPWRESHVICGGHSLGGPLTEIYASWDFDGNRATTEDAGYRQCAGFIGFDTALNAGSADPKSVPDKSLLGKFTAGLISGASKATVQAIKAGTIPRHVDLLGINPESMTLLEAIAVRADQLPDEEITPVVATVPKTPGVEQFLKLAGSPDLLSWLGGRATLRDLRYTNMAFLAQVMDDNGGAYGLVRTSFGYFDGAPLRRNLMPVQAAIIPGLGFLISPGRLMLPQKQRVQQLARWKSYDELGSGATQLGAGVTTPGDEVTDAGQFARAIHEGPLNLTENWFPIRMVVDQGLLALGDRSGDLSGSMHGRKTDTKPRVVVVAGDGIRPDDKPYDPQVLAPGYQHLDVLTAAERQNNGQPELSSQTLANLIDQAVAR